MRINFGLFSLLVSKWQNHLYWWVGFVRIGSKNHHLLYTGCITNNGVREWQLELFWVDIAGIYRKRKAVREARRKFNQEIEDQRIQIEQGVLKEPVD